MRHAYTTFHLEFNEPLNRSKAWLRSTPATLLPTPFQEIQPATRMNKLR